MENDLQPEGRDYRKGAEIFTKITALFGGLTLTILATNAAIKKANAIDPEEHDQNPDTVDEVQEDEGAEVAAEPA